MKLRGVTFENWLRSHEGKGPKERWLRELYPWPVLARVDCDDAFIGEPQKITHDDTDFTATLLDVRWQPDRGTSRFRVHVQSDGLGWHARSFADEYDMCAAPDGTFVTLFHAGKEEPLEKIARAFFGRRWESLDPKTFATLAVSRFIAAALIGEIATEAFAPIPLEHYPAARLVGSVPMLAHGDDLWIGQRYYSEDAFAWSRRNAGRARRVVGIYLADTKYQFKTDLSPGTEVRSASQLDAESLDRHYEDLIRVLMRRLEIPDGAPPPLADEVLEGRSTVAPIPVSESDVHEALAALRTPARSKDDLRYQLAAAVVLNAWIEEERRLGYSQRRRFYAFKQHVDHLARWAIATRLDNVEIWSEQSGAGTFPILFVRIGNVDFSFHAIPVARELPQRIDAPTWSGVRLKPIAPLVLRWARALRQRQP